MHVMRHMVHVMHVGMQMGNWDMPLLRCFALMMMPTMWTFVIGVTNGGQALMSH